MFNINAEFAAQLAPRPIAEVARSIAFSSSPDAILVSGAITSQAAASSHLAEVVEAVAGTGIPVLVNTGLKASNATELLGLADGAIVGTSLKVDGVTWNRVERDRVRALMDVVEGVRGA